MDEDFIKKYSILDGLNVSRETTYPHKSLKKVYLIYRLELFYLEASRSDL